MLVTITTVTIKPGKAGDFETVLRAVAEKSEAREPGCLSYRGFRKKDAPATFIVVEQYRDRAALDAHRTTDHFAEAMEKAGGLMAAEPQITFCEPVD